jgi:hypothetical protein
MRRPTDEDPDRRREREFDTITFVLAGLLSAVVLGAVGYGILKAPKGATIPSSLSMGSQGPRLPASTTGTR